MQKVERTTICIFTCDCFRCGINSMPLVVPKYIFKAYQDMSDGSFNLLMDSKYWPVAELRLSLLTDRLKSKTADPLKTSRIRNRMDRRCLDAPCCCSNCLQLGHTTPNCPFASYFYQSLQELQLTCVRYYHQTFILYVGIN